MTKNIYIQAIRFVRDIVQAKKKATRKDVENFVEMLKTLNAPLNDLEYLKNELENHINNKIHYFQKTNNKAKLEEYTKIKILTKKFLEFYEEKIRT